MTQTATDNPAAPAPTPARPADASDAAIAVDRLTHHYAAPQRPHRGRRAKAQASPPAADPAASADRRPALDRFELTVMPGEIFGILGPNGSGKSTLFRILSTLMRPSDSQARVELFDIDVLSRPAAARQQLGVVFQSPSLDDQLTVEENLRTAGTLYGLRGSALREPITRWLQRMQLTDRRDHRVRTLSGGLQRRVELAKAMLPQPRLLLLDEPSTGLDIAARRQLWQHLRELRREHGVTIALTTHLMDEAEQCDRLAILHEGKRVALDTVDALKSIIGGEVVTLEPQPADVPHRDDSPERFTPGDLAERIAERFGPWPEGGAPAVVDGRVRLEHAEGAQLVAQIASAWPHQVRSFTVGRPTLEDVFLHLTGKQFES